MSARPHWFSPTAALYGSAGVICSCAGSWWGFVFLLMAMCLLYLEGRLDW